MQEWLKISCLLCIFGFVREIRPSESYLNSYILEDFHNVTQDEIDQEVYPVSTYSYLALLVIIFLITDFLRYKPVIITNGVCGIIVFILLLWTTSLIALQISQFIYGAYLAAEVAYYTYIYAKVDRKYYPKVTGNSRAAMFLGKLVASGSAQLLVNFKAMNYRQLTYISFATQILATLWAFVLPKVDRSLYFHRKTSLSEQVQDSKDQEKKDPDNRDHDNKVQDNKVLCLTVLDNKIQDHRDLDYKVLDSKSTLDQPRTSQQTTLTAFTKPWKLLWLHFRNAYTNRKVIQWSIWYAVSFCGYMQVSSYIQVLWRYIKPHPSIAWNGAVDAVMTLLMALSALTAGYIHAGRLQPRTSLLLLSALAVLEGGALLLCCWLGNIYVAYVGYVIFGTFYAFSITVASAKVARYLEADSFGLVFGINTFIALVFQTILTIVVVTKAGFALNAKGQYTVYGFYFIVVACLYFISVAIEYCVDRRSLKKDTESNIEIVN